jgi:small lipoprotein (TIGR04454 family)
MKLEFAFQKTQKTIQKKPKKKKKTVFTEPRQDILCKNPIEELNRMKKILVIAMLLVTSILFSNCSKEVVSAAECGPIVDQMFTNLVKELKPEEAEKAKSMEAAIKLENTILIASKLQPTSLLYKLVKNKIYSHFEHRLSAEFAV